MGDDSKDTRADKTRKTLREIVREGIQDYFKDVDIAAGEKPPTKDKGDDSADRKADADKGDTDGLDSLADLLGIK